MTTDAWVLLAAVGAAPLAAVGWLRWRMRPAATNARADRLLADAEARMRARDDAALLALLAEAPLGDSAVARRLRGAVKKRRYGDVQQQWGLLWPELVGGQPRQLELDVAIDLGAAIKVLVERHAKR
jgi:hypothetical protein